MAARVRSRLERVAWRRWLVASHLWFALFGIVVIAAWRGWGGLRSTLVAVLVAAAVLVVWLLAGRLWSRLRRPSELGALVIWDEFGHWNDTFSSALAFEKKAVLEAGERLHVERARAAAEEAVEEIDAVLPKVSLKTVWWAPLLLLAFAFSNLLVPAAAPGDEELSDAMREAAARAGADLADAASRLGDDGELDEEEKAEMDRLKEAVDGVSGELAESEGMSAREVLEALEERAKAAERLAEKLGATDNAWASEEMLAEMAQHADTSDLATVIRDKNAQAAAAESDDLAVVLDREDLTQEAEQRIAEALDRTMQKATEDDLAKPVGEHVGNASRKLGDREPKPASRDFSRLADHFRRIVQREKAQRELEELAEKLRESGSEIAGAELQPMEQLADSPTDSPPPGAPQPVGEPPQGMPMAQTPEGDQPGQMGAAGQVQPLTVPGLQSPPQAQPGDGNQNPGAAPPVPGSGQAPGEQDGEGQQGLAGGPSSDDSKPGGQPAMLSAPIPGMDPGQGASGASLGGQSQSAGQLAASGGLEAGNATAELGNAESTPMKATDESTVTAQVNEDGESTLRAVEGQARAERAQVERREAAIDFIQVEEDALDEQALPQSRREHVRKYFTELRERFEPAESGGQP